MISSAPPVDPATRAAARRGVALFLTVLVAVSALTVPVLLATGNPAVGLVALCAPALAAVGTRLVRREGFADVSFRLGGRRGRRALVWAVVLPLLIALVSYGAAWAAGLAGFDPPAGLGPLGGDVTDSAAASFALQVLLAAVVTGLGLSIVAIGEEVGWRGYLLPRLIDTGLPRPVLAHGLIWAAWHLPLALGAGYAAGSSLVVSVPLLVVQITAAGFVLAWLRLSSGSVWPAVLFHGVWNAVVQTAFDPATTGAAATTWVGESGILTTLAVIGVAVLLWRRSPTSRAQTVAPAPEATRTPLGVRDLTRAPVVPAARGATRPDQEVSR
ncbi:CPBP family intramembrane glutamic endopeptidase [Geodermatophilus sp. SYSU D00766]